MASAASIGVALQCGIVAVGCIVGNVEPHDRKYIIGLPDSAAPPLVDFLLPWSLVPWIFLIVWFLIGGVLSVGVLKLHARALGV